MPIALTEFTVNFIGALNCLHGAPEFDKKGISRRVYYSIHMTLNSVATEASIQY